MWVYIVIEFDSEYCDNIAVFRNRKKAHKFLIEKRKQAKQQNQEQDYMIEANYLYDDLF